MHRVAGSRGEVEEAGWNWGSGGGRGKRSGMEAIARGGYSQGTPATGFPPDAILAEANRIQRKRSHVHIRPYVRAAHVYVSCMYVRVHARECCRGTV